MIVALEEKYGASPEAMVLDAFSAFDVNGDGNVSREELKERGGHHHLRCGFIGFEIIFGGVPLTSFRWGFV